MTKFPLSFLLAPLLLLAAMPAAAGDDPAAANLALFLADHGHQSGLPDPATAEAMRPMITAALDADFAAARIAQTAFIAAHPDEKPPMVEGPIFNSSGYEPYTDLAIAHDPAADGAGAGSDGDRRTLKVTFTDSTVTPALTWTDEFAMVHEGGAWRVDDVAYRAGFEYGNSGTLRASLRAVVDDVAGDADAAAAAPAEPPAD